MATLSAGTDSSAVGLRQTFNYTKTHTYYFAQLTSATAANYGADPNPNLVLDTASFSPITVVNTGAAFRIVNPEPNYPMFITITYSLGAANAATATPQDNVRIYFVQLNPITFSNLGQLSGANATYVPALPSTGIGGYTFNAEATCSIVLNTTQSSIVVRPQFTSLNGYTFLPYTTISAPYTSIIITTNW